MRRFVAIMMVVVACDGGKQAPKPPPMPSATGSVVLTPRSPSEADIALANEAEILRSSQLVKRTNDDVRRDDLRTDQVTVGRRPGTTILDVTVRMTDPNLAADFCNALIKVYIEYHHAQRILPLQQQRQAIAAELDRTPGDKDLLHKEQELYLAIQTVEPDARVLDQCAPHIAP
jgi:uncharacterized protein involved in exopolysaccharide biosynthesis